MLTWILIFFFVPRFLLLFVSFLPLASHFSLRSSCFALIQRSYAFTLLRTGMSKWVWEVPSRRDKYVRRWNKYTPLENSTGRFCNENNVCRVFSSFPPIDDQTKGCYRRRERSRCTQIFKARLKGYSFSYKAETWQDCQVPSDVHVPRARCCIAIY